MFGMFVLYNEIRSYLKYVFRNKKKLKSFETYRKSNGPCDTHLNREKFTIRLCQG